MATRIRGQDTILFAATGGWCGSRENNNGNSNMPVHTLQKVLQDVSTATFSREGAWLDGVGVYECRKQEHARHFLIQIKCK